MEDNTLEWKEGTPWAEVYIGSGRPTGRLAMEPVYGADGHPADNWEWVGNKTREEFDAWFEREERAEFGPRD